MSMSVTLTIITIISWIFLFLMLFLFERMDRRLSAVTIANERLLQQQQAILDHLGITPAEPEKLQELRELLANGRVLEAQTAYRAWSGSTHKEARIFIDSLLEDKRD